MNKNILSRYHALIEILGFVLILASFAVAIAAMASGEMIPSHYDFAGNVTDYSKPGFLIMMPIVMLISNGSMSLILHFMSFSSWSMPVKVKPGRERAVYGCVGYMIAIMELLFGIFSLAFTLFSGAAMGKMLMPLSVFFVVALFADIIVCCVLAVKLNGR
ncbi:MAG: DUF1648 domain-containing protein [Lachnospiraceae bacterium]